MRVNDSAKNIRAYETGKKRPLRWMLWRITCALRASWEQLKKIDWEYDKKRKKKCA